MSFQINKGFKKSTEATQLDLVDSISHATKLHRKRRIVVIALVLTIGTSLCLWTYRSLSLAKFSFSLPQFALPTAPDFANQLNSLLATDSNSWSFYLSITSSSKPPYFWQKNSDILTSNSQFKTATKLVQDSGQSSTSLATVLPSGAQIKEKIIIDKPDQYQVYYLITVPQNEFFIALNISSSTDLLTKKNMIPKIIDKFYWLMLAFVG